jgi:hypothetical protein
VKASNCPEKEALPEHLTRWVDGRGCCLAALTRLGWPSLRRDVHVLTSEQDPQSSCVAPAKWHKRRAGTHSNFKDSDVAKKKSANTTAKAGRGEGSDGERQNWHKTGKSERQVR